MRKGALIRNTYDDLHISYNEVCYAVRSTSLASKIKPIEQLVPCDSQERLMV